MTTNTTERQTVSAALGIDDLMSHAEDGLAVLLDLLHSLEAKHDREDAERGGDQ